MSTLRVVVEIVLGLLYSAGAVFNTVYTLRHGDKFYGAFLDGAWLPPARWFLRTIVLPNATAFTVLLVLFELVMAIVILGRGDLVKTALVAGAIFATLAAIVSSPAGTVGNLGLAVLQAVLAMSR